MDILIYSQPEKVTHKMKNFIADGCYCFWTSSIIPALAKLYDIDKVYFSNGNRIYAEGDFLPDITEEISVICFDPLIKVNKNTIRFKKLLRKFKRLQIASMPYNKFDLLDLD